MKSDLVDIKVQLHHETDKAVFVSDDGNRYHAVWLPRSQIEIELDDDPRFITVTLPEWLAKEKRLI